MEKNHLMITSKVTLINTASFLKLLFKQKHKYTINSYIK